MINYYLSLKNIQKEDFMEEEISKPLINENKLKDLFKKVKVNTPSLIDINNNELNFLDHKYLKYKQRISTNSILKITPLYIFAIATISLFSEYVYNILNKDIIDYLIYLKEYIIKDNNIKLNSIFLLLPLYTLQIIIIIFAVAKYKNQTVFTTNDSNYWSFSVFLIYVGFGLIIIYFFIDDKLSLDISSKIITYYLLIPIMILYMSIPMVIVPYMVAKKSKNYISKHLDESRLDIGFKLLKILDLLKVHANSLNLISKADHQRIMFYIFSISNTIKNCSNNISEETCNSFFEADFHKKALGFEMRTLAIITSKSSEILELRNIITEYANAFISGNLDGLPNYESELPKTNRRAKLKHIISLGLYLAFPIIVLSILQFISDYSINENVMTMLKYLYFIWIGIGIYSNSKMFGSDNSDSFKNIFNTILGR